MQTLLLYRNLSDVDAARCGSCHSCHSCCCSGGSGGSISASNMMMNKRASLADRWSQIVLEESELDAAVLPESTTRKSPRLVAAAATAWSLSPSPRLDHRATAAELSGVGFGYEQFEVMDRLVGCEEEEEGVVACSNRATSKRNDASAAQGSPFWRSVRRRLEDIFVRSKGANEALS